MKIQNQAGFSSKEFLLVMIVILGLCLTSIPLFHLMQNRAHAQRVTETVDLLRQQLKVTVSQPPLGQRAFPPVLDTDSPGKACTDCFVGVLGKGLSSKHWLKLSPTEYLYSKRISGKISDLVNTKGNYRVTYDATQGIIDVTVVK